MEFNPLDFVAGCVGGMAGTVVGHPFDTVKTRLQLQDPIMKRYAGIRGTFVKIAVEESMFGLFKGLLPPLVGLSLINTVVFGVYGNIIRNVKDPDKLHNQALAGATAGLAQTWICSPSELAKLRMQSQGIGRARGEGNIYRNSCDCLIQAFRAGGVRELFRGYGITAIREVPAFAIYFTTYESLVRRLCPAGTNKPSWVLLLAGGLAGSASWAFTCPIDVIKSRIQTDTASARRYTGIVDCVVKSYRSEGYRVFFHGLGSSVIRAFPVNAVTFYVVEFIMSHAPGQRAVS